MKIPLIIGHRGAMGTVAENTASSFKKALETGADGVEFDIHMSKDGELVVIHDERIDRVVDNGSGFVKDFTLKELKGFDIGSKFSEEFKGEKVLSLKETLDIVKDSKIINIEIKNGPIFYPEIEEKTIDIINTYNISNKVIVSSFNHYTIKKIKELSGEIKCALLYMAGLYKPWEYAKKIAAEAIHPYIFSITPELIKECQKSGIMINVFAVNEDDYLAKFIHLGVDGIITDYPEKARNILKNYLKR
ncbi:glycerophosphodiester phosphodiesterase [Natronospora cellulosivora (SeqCode)]